MGARGGRILAVGGNVRGRVSLKLLPAVSGWETARSIGEGAFGRSAPPFAHLKLRAPSIEGDALVRTPTIEALGCSAGFRVPAQLVAANLGFLRSVSCAE